MKRLCLGMMVAGFIVGCDMKEPDTSGVLVDPDYDVEIPDWLSIQDVDHNGDGTINVLDLVLVAKFFGQDVPEDNEDTTIDTIELRKKYVGVLFSIAGARSVHRLEAHNSDGKVEGALARWQTSIGADIFAVEGSDGLFLTDTALEEKVTELIGFDEHDNRVLKANVSVEAREDTITVTSALFTDGGYTWIAFSENPNPDPEDDITMKDKEKNVYLSFDTDMRVVSYYKGWVQHMGRDGRGIWVGTPNFECVVGEKVMARVVNTVYVGTCLPNKRY